MLAEARKCSTCCRISTIDFENPDKNTRDERTTRAFDRRNKKADAVTETTARPDGKIRAEINGRQIRSILKPIKKHRLNGALLFDG